MSRPKQWLLVSWWLLFVLNVLALVFDLATGRYFTAVADILLGAVSWFGIKYVKALS